MQEHIELLPQNTDEPAPNSLLTDAETLALNQSGKISPVQLRQHGPTISLARWLLYPIGMTLLVMAFIAGLFAGLFGSALHLSFEVMAAQYGLLLAGLLFGIPIAGGRDVLLRVGGGAFLGLGFSLVVWAATQSVQIFIMSGLMFGILAGFGGLAQIANGGSRDIPSGTSLARKVFAAASMVCLAFWALWFLSSFALLLLFMISVNWVGPVVVAGFFYALFVWATADEYFAGRAAKRAVARSHSIPIQTS